MAIHILKQFRNLFQAIQVIVLVVFIAACSRGEHGETRIEVIKSASANKPTDAGVLHTVPFITLRNKTGSDKPVEYFGDERSSAYFGLCNVLSTPLKRLEELAKKTPFYIPNNMLKLEGIEEFSEEEFWRNLKISADGRRPVLYLHGFNISFNRGCRRAALFQENLGLSGQLVLFSWPSDGAITNYTRDESDLYWSVAPLQQTLNEMVTRFGAGGFDVVAHSLGTRGVFLALLQMANGKHHAEPVVNQLILAAPDIDVGIFKQYLPQIQSLARNITIYASANDNPLMLSREVHGYPRLGESGPHLDTLRGVEIIDISNAGVRFPSGHLYHLYHEVVVNDMNKIIETGKSAAKRGNLKKTGANHWQMQLPDTETQERIRS